MELPFNFDKTVEGLSKVTLKGGVVGKVTFAVVVVVLSIALIAWSVANVWLSVAALVAVFVLAFTMLWRLISFADRHPQAALLEGAEFLVHEQIVHASKASAGARLLPTEQVLLEPVDETPQAIEQALQPDVTPRPLSSREDTD